MKKLILLEDVDARQTNLLQSSLAMSISMTRPQLVSETATALFAKYGDSKQSVPLDMLEESYRRAWPAALTAIDAADTAGVLLLGAAAFLLGDALREVRDRHIIVVNPLQEALESIRARSAKVDSLTWVCFAGEDGFRPNKIFSLHKRLGGDLHVIDSGLDGALETRCGLIREILKA